MDERHVRQRADERRDATHRRELVRVLLRLEIDPSDVDEETLVAGRDDEALHHARREHDAVGDALLGVGQHPRLGCDVSRAAVTLLRDESRDRRGLMHFLTRALTAQNLQISTAKISTFGHRVVDVFYVKDQFGLKIESETRLKAIRDSLMQVLQEREADFAPTKAADATSVVTAAQ